MTKTPPPSRNLQTVYARRSVLLGGGIIAAVSAARWYNIGGRVEGGALSVSDAHAAAVKGDITLVDIRRPDEWARTGIGQGAIPIDMRDTDFLQKLLIHVDDRDAPVALICARGVRSRGLSVSLSKERFTNVLDVPEGMLGSGAGPGWLASGLPVVRV